MRPRSHLPPGRRGALRRAGLAAALAPLTVPVLAAGWPEGLPALAPALRACLAGAPDAFAIQAVPDGRGRVAVRLWHTDGGEDCTAEEGRVIRRMRVPDAPPPPPATPAFFLERRCVDARRVDGPDGRPLGWLAYPACG